MRTIRDSAISKLWSVRVWCGCLALIAAGPTMVSAQDQTSPSLSRTSLLIAERDQKATRVAPPERSSTERALYWYDNQYVLSKVFGGWHGFHLAGGDFPAGAGVKFGVGFTRELGSAASVANPERSNRFDVDAVAAYSTRGYTRLGAALNFRNIGGAPFDVRVRGQYFEFPQEDFFGLGPDSREQDRTDYLLGGIDTGVDVQWKAMRFVDLTGGVAYLNNRVGSGTDARFPSTERVFDVRTLPGFSEQPDFVRTNAGVAFDWRDNPLHPHAGGRYGVRLADFRDRDLDAFDFRRVQLDVQQYVPLPNRYRTIALRAAAVFTDADSGQQVPFFYQPTLGGSQALRGFREFRFRDQNSLLLTAEYRWEAWWALDGALFVDAGKVAARRRDLTFDDLDVSYGIGFRVHSNNAFVARLDLAFSREGFIPLLRFEHVF
jgi:outer membrane protein assembly factor BamA